jgi:hypothetical protein
MILQTSLDVSLVVGLSSPLMAQKMDWTPPVIDVHSHAPMRAGPPEDFRQRTATRPKLARHGTIPQISTKSTL